MGWGLVELSHTCSTRRYGPSTAPTFCSGGGGGALPPGAACDLEEKLPVARFGEAPPAPLRKYADGSGEVKPIGSFLRLTRREVYVCPCMPYRLSPVALPLKYRRSDLGVPPHPTNTDVGQHREQPGVSIAWRRSHLVRQRQRGYKHFVLLMSRHGKVGVPIA